MTFRSPEQPRAARLVLRTTYLALGLAVAATLGGCPGGADLENPDRFPQAGTPGTGAGGATGGGAGVGGTAGAAQGGSAGGAGMGAGAGGAAGSGSGTYTWNCTDVALEGPTGALAKNCARASCHNATTKSGGLEMTDVAKVRAGMVGVPATFSDFGCNAPGTPYKECTREEAIQKGCPDGVLLIDPANVDQSWVLTKMTGTGHGECGDAMPFAPGNAAANGWDAEGRRKACFIEFFRSLAAPQ